MATLNGTTEARAINNLGIIVGYSVDPAGYNKACRWDPANGTPYAIEDLSALGGTPTYNSEGYGINKAGYVVGRSQANVSGSVRYRGFVCLPDNFISTTGTDIGVLSGGDTSYAYAINDCNVVAGSSTSGGTAHTAVIKRPGDSDPQSLGLVSGTGYSYGYAINNAGVVVGRSGDFAFIARVGMNATKLNSFISTLGGVSLVTATAINDNLVIVGSGYDGSGYSRAFVIYP